MNKAAKETPTRLYLVTGKDSGKHCALVEAANVHQARSHASRKYFEVRHASQRDCIEAAKAGLEPEKASNGEAESE
jgi:hypothetical protein